MYLTASALALSAMAASAAAKITVISPWAEDSWKSGGHGNISWQSDPSDENLKCEIQMLNGNTDNSNIVGYVTDPNIPVPCSVHEYNINPLNDFKAGKYWIRIGQSATNSWSYSGQFNFDGTGAAQPLALAEEPLPAAAPKSKPSSAAASSAPVTASGSMMKSASVTGSTAPSGSAASAAVTGSLHFSSTKKSSAAGPTTGSSSKGDSKDDSKNSKKNASKSAAAANAPGHHAIAMSVGSAAVAAVVAAFAF